MTSLTPDVEDLKQDVRGRVRVSRERRESLLDEFERGGMSGAQFVRLAGIKYSTFAAWVLQRRKARNAQGAEVADRVPAGAAAASGKAIQWFEAVAEEAGHARLGTETAGLRIELPGGSRVVVESPMQVGLAAELVAQVAQSLRTRC